MTDLYHIRNIGCDDETIGLCVIPPEALNLVKMTVENLNKNSNYGCMPIIEIYRINESFVRPATEKDESFNVMHTTFGNYVLTKSLWRYNLETKNCELEEGVEKVC